MRRRRDPHRNRFVRRRIPRGAPLPGDRFGVLVGMYDHQTLTPQGRFSPDDNHVYLWVRVPDLPHRPGGVYECAFNIHSTAGSRVEFTELEEELEEDDVPSYGFTPSSLFYPDLGLVEEDFTPVRHGDLHVLVTQYAERCERIAVYGITYDDGTGIHDIHMCHGEIHGSRYANRRNEDGALVFFFRRSSPQMPPTAQWVCVKFATQRLRLPPDQDLGSMSSL